MHYFFFNELVFVVTVCVRYPFEANGLWEIIDTMNLGVHGCGWNVSCRRNQEPLQKNKKKIKVQGGKKLKGRKK